jgi:ABC-type multidrug transport system fused ATPase/permease subunit
MMPSIVSKISELFDAKERKHLFLLVCLIIFNGIIESAGIVSITPFMAVVATPGTIQTNTILSTLYRVSGAENSNEFLILLGIFMLAAVVISNVVNAVTYWLINRFAYYQGFNLSKRLLSGYLGQPYLFFLTHNTTDLARNVYDEVSRAVNGVILPALNVVSKSVVSLFIFGLILAVDWKLAVIVIGVLGSCYALIYRLLRNRVTIASNVASQARALAFRLASEALSGAKDIKLLGNEQRWLDIYAKPAESLAHAEASNQVWTALPRYILEPITFGGLLLIIIYFLVSQKSAASILPLLALYAFSGYRLMPALQQITSNINYMNFYTPSLNLLHKHLTELELPRAQGKGRRSPLSLKRTIELKDIGFTYPENQQPALDGISLTMSANTIIGFVGPTGSSKTTLLDIVLGLLTPNIGELRVDGVTVNVENVASWQANIGYVPQRIYLIDDTVVRNIAFGVPDSEINMEAVIAAASIAQIHEFISGELPQGYETVVGEEGTRLSGGQQQRIGIARALYRDPPVLVLDEATSSLDNLTEAAVMKALNAMAHKKTIIVVAHRLSTIRPCNCIYLIVAGKLTDQGTYEELLERSQLFRDMAAGRYLKGEDQMQSGR